MKVLKIDELVIRGVRYKVRLLNDKDFEILHGNQADAVTSSSGCLIDIKASELTLQKVRHEVFHAFYNCSFTESADLSPLQVEECLAEMFANFGTEMIELSNKLFNKFNKEGRVEIKPKREEKPA